MSINGYNLFGFYSKEISDSLRVDLQNASLNSFRFEISEIGEFPLSGPYQIFNDSEWISRHEEKVKQDVIKKVRDKSFDGIILIDYRKKWHPHFDYPENSSFHNGLSKSQWNSVVQEFYLKTISAIKDIIPKAKVGFVDLPGAVYKNDSLVSVGPGIVGYGTRFDAVKGDSYNNAQKLNNDLSWLWEKVDVLAPLVRAIRYTIEDKKTPQTGIENIRSTNSSYISSNTLEAYRLHSLYKSLYVLPVFEHVYSSLPPYSRKPLNEINWEQQLTVPFISGAHAIGALYEYESDPDGNIQSDYLDEIERLLPSVPQQENSGGSRNRPVGGLSNSGSDTISSSKSISTLSEIDIEEFLPIEVISSTAGTLSETDHRPVRVYIMWEDSFLSSTGASNAFASWWQAADGVSNLINKLTDDYSLGFRRFLFYMPAGNQINNEEKYSPNQWGPMISSRKAAIQSQLSDWISNNNEEIEIIVHGGIKIEPNLSKLDTHEIDYDNAETYDVVNNSLHLQYFEQNWNPWLDIGLSSLSFHDTCDIGSERLFFDVVISQSLLGTKVYGSCLPISSPQEIDTDRVGLTSWFVKYDDFLELQGTESFVFDKDTTEVGVLLTPQMAFSSTDLQSAVDSGLVIFAAEGTIADNFLFGESSSSSSTGSAVSFVEVPSSNSDTIEGFGVSRYNSVNTSIDNNSEPDYLNYNLVSIANSINGVVVLNKEMTKKDILTISITNPIFDNTSLPHATIEDTFEWVNSGLPSHLSQTRDSNLLQMGLNLSKTNSSAMQMVPPYQAKYILPCSTDVYDVFNSTVDFEELVNFGKRNFSIPYPTSIIYIESLGQVWVGGAGGVLSIDVETYKIDEVVIDSRRDLQIKDMHVSNDQVFILDQTALYTYDTIEKTSTRDPGLGLPSNIFEIVGLFNTNLVIGAEDGIYARKELQDSWTFVQESEVGVGSIISPDATFAIAKNEVFYSTDGFSWTLIGTTNQNINSLVKYRNKIYLATDNGIREDGGFFYAERVNLRLVDVFNDASLSADIVANDIDSSVLQVVSGLSDGRLVTINDFGISISDSGFDTIHKVLIVNEEVWMFSYNTFKIKSESQIRRLASGQRL